MITSSYIVIRVCSVSRTFWNTSSPYGIIYDERKPMSWNMHSAVSDLWTEFGSIEIGELDFSVEPWWETSIVLLSSRKTQFFSVTWNELISYHFLLEPILSWHAQYPARPRYLCFVLVLWTLFSVVVFSVFVPTILCIADCFCSKCFGVTTWWCNSMLYLWFPVINYFQVVRQRSLIAMSVSNLALQDL